MDHAIIVAAGTGIEEEKLSLHGKTVFGSLPQIKRLVITAQRAGIKKFTIITETGDTSLKDLLAGDRRIESDIGWHSLGSEIKLDSAHCLIIQSNLITTPRSLANFMESDCAQDEVAVLVDSLDDAWIKASGEEISDVFSWGGKAVGAFIVSGRLLEKSIMNSMSLRTFVQEHIGRDKVKLRKFTDSYWMRLDSGEDAAARAEDLIFAHVGKTATGWLSRNINSKISLPTSRLLVRTPLTPNMISVLINIIGMMCGVFYAIGHPVWGALCMQAATILDRCDGEVARVKLMETHRGQWVDTISDQVTVLSFMLGVPIGYYVISKSPLAVILGAVNVSIFIFFVVWSFYFLKKYTNSGSLVTYFDVDKLVEGRKASLMRRLIKIVRPMGRRNFYSLAFLVIAIVGGYFWLLVVTAAAMTLFLLHQLEDMIKLRRVDPNNSILK
ncbi:MAG TPA: CDP-alcohol phosphatidyltransferase family protein [Thermodesulfobacteriota bacterium]|nr:CDP-alcohol phosphatidyltransferase family protein [Thermodesulfobacteriota bacterium]